MSEVMRKRVWLIGEQNPYSSDPKFALYPLPKGAAGARLMRALDLDPHSYLALFERRNLLGSERWSAPAAREAAARIGGKLQEGDCAVLLGAKVAAAFGYPYDAHLLPYRDERLGVSLLVVPHPSGRSRAWNDPSVAPRVRRQVRMMLAGGESAYRLLRQIFEKLASLFALCEPVPDCDVERASDLATCLACGDRYGIHAQDPREPWMTLLCDGRRAKL